MLYCKLMATGDKWGGKPWVHVTSEYARRLEGDLRQAGYRVERVEDGLRVSDPGEREDVVAVIELAEETDLPRLKGWLREWCANQS